MTAMAQEQTPPPAGPPAMGQGQRQQQTAAVRTEIMAKDLNLTEVEKAKVLEVFEKHDAIFAKFRADVSRDSPDFREKFTALREAQTADLVKVVGQERYDTYQKLQAERRQKANPNN